MQTQPPLVESAAERSSRRSTRGRVPDAANGNDAELDALLQTMVISGDEQAIRTRIDTLLASGLDELMLHFLPLADEVKERHEFLQLIGSL